MFGPEKTMFNFLLGTTIAATLMAAPPAQRDDKAAPKSLDGNWTVVCCEKNGQPVTDAKDAVVKIDGNTLTCTGRDGKPTMSMKINFEGNGTISVSDTTGLDPVGTAASEKPATKKGVVICTSDYCAICVHDDVAKGVSGTLNTTTNEPTTKSKCTVILKREGSDTRRDK